MTSQQDSGPVRGIIRRDAGVMDHRTWPAPPELRPWIEHLWSVDWDLRGRSPQRNRVISFPAVHLTAEWGSESTRHGLPLPATLVHGVVSRVFEVELGGRGGVVGARFRPDGFAAWSGLDVSLLTDEVRPAAEVLGSAYEDLHTELSTRPDATDRVARLVTALRHMIPAVRPARRRLADLVDRLAADETITRVEQLVDLGGCSLRTLQRHFRSDIGVSPKWVLTRFRLQHAAFELERDPDADLAALAVRLGWYDQAHLTGDFARLLGETPGEYAARARAAADPSEQR